MASIEYWDAPDIVPSITYTDVPHAIEWLQRVFGFHDRADARLTWPGGSRAWFEVGNSLFNICTPDATWRQDPGSATLGFVMKVYVDDLDEHFARAKAEGSTIISEPENGLLGWSRLQGARSRGAPVGDLATRP